MTGPTIPPHLQHESGTVEALLLTAWFAGDIGVDAAHTLARDILQRHNPDVDGRLDVIIGLLDEWAHCSDDPGRYADDEGITRPAGVTWVEWSETHRQILADDAAMYAEQLADTAYRTAATA